MPAKPLVLLATLACLAACSPPTQTAAAPPQPATPAATPPPAALDDASTPRQIHDALIIPGSEALFAAENTPPANDQQWTDLEAAARKVIDGAGLMKTGSRPQGRADWSAAADVVIVNTKLTADALAHRNAGDLVFTDGDMMAGCTSCHQKFRFTTPATATEPAH